MLGEWVAGFCITITNSALAKSEVEARLSLAIFIVTAFDVVRLKLDFPKFGGGGMLD